jgi:hypothetical protein
MANRYWVGGSGTWDTTTTHWSATSGGAGGASAPSVSDSVFFDQNGSYTVTVSTTRSCLDLNVTATGGFAFAGTSYTINVYGNIYFGSGLTNPVLGGTPSLIGILGSSSFTIRSNGQNIPCAVTMNATGGTYQLQDDFTQSSGSAGFTLSGGTIDLNNFSLHCVNFTSNSGTRSILFGASGAIKVDQSASGGTMFSMTNATGFTYTGSGSVYISYSGANACTVSNPTTATEATSLSFYINAGTYALTFMSASSYAKTVDFTGFSGTWSAPTGARNIYGNLTLSSSMTYSTSTNQVIFAGTVSTQLLTTNGVTFNQPITINGVGGLVKLQGAVTLGSTYALSSSNGTLDLNGYTLTATSASISSGTQNITFNGGTLLLTGSGSLAFSNGNTTGFTTTAGTGTGKISMTSASAKTFAGGGFIYNCTLSNDGAGALTISGANTFTTIANGVQPTAFTFTSGTTTTLTNWNVRGTSGNLVTITATTAGTAATLSKSSGTVSSNYLSLKDSAATGGATWYAGANSTNVSGNSGWLFANAPSASFFFMF